MYSKKNIFFSSFEGMIAYNQSSVSLNIPKWPKQTVSSIETNSITLVKDTYISLCFSSAKIWSFALSPYLWDTQRKCIFVTADLLIKNKSQKGHSFIFSSLKSFIMVKSDIKTWLISKWICAMYCFHYSQWTAKHLEIYSPNRYCQ